MARGLVVAGGDALRFGRPGGKQLAGLGGSSVLARSVAAVASCPRVESLVVVCHPERLEEYARAVGQGAGDLSFMVIAGGDTRQASVAAGLRAMEQREGIVVIHDGARPLAPPALFDAVIARLEEDTGISGTVAAHPATDTVKLVDGTAVVETPPRASVWAVQTPQAFRLDALLAAHEAAAGSAPDATDDAALVERYGGRIRVVEGPRWNIKVTTEEDLVCAEALLAGGVAGG